MFKNKNMRICGNIIELLKYEAYFLSEYRFDIKKKIWRRKCVRRAIFRNVDIRVERGFAPFNPHFVCNTSNCVTVRSGRGHLTPKMNVAFFIRNLMLNIFLYDNFFEKSCIFRETRKKLFWGSI